MQFYYVSGTVLVLYIQSMKPEYPCPQVTDGKADA